MELFKASQTSLTIEQWLLPLLEGIMKCKRNAHEVKTDEQHPNIYKITITVEELSQ